MMLAVMSLLFHYSGVRLSNSVAMVIAGLVIGAAEWHDGPFAISEVRLPIWNCPLVHRLLRMRTPATQHAQSAMVHHESRS